jgi:hypothetical protein
VVRLLWPLIGRSEEMQLVEAAIADPDLSGAVVSGAPGVGKSRIVREALSQAKSKGRTVRWVMGTSAARSLPLGVFASFGNPTAVDSLEAVRAVIESLTAALPGTTAVIGVDDVHLLDDLSTFVLHQIVQSRLAHVLMTVRSGEDVPEGIRDVWKIGRFDRLELQPLAREEATTLVSAALSGSIDPDAAARLWRLTRGNALYLSNIVEQEVTDGRLSRHDGVWRWTGEPVVSPGLIELIEARIGALPIATSDVLDAVVVGEPLALGSLARITGAAAVEDAEVRGLITLEPTDTGAHVRLAHPIYGEVRKRRAVATRLRRIRGLVAEELAAAEDADDIGVVVRRAALSPIPTSRQNRIFLSGRHRAPYRLATCGSPTGWWTRRFAPVPASTPNFFALAYSPGSAAETRRMHCSRTYPRRRSLVPNGERSSFRERSTGSSH